MAAGPPLSERLHGLLNPRGVVIVGVHQHESVAAGTAALLDACGFGDRCHLVDPAGAEFHGRSTVRSIAEIAGEVDFAMVLVPMAEMWQTLEQLAAIGVRGVCISTPGWAETGEDGQERQRDLVRRAESLGMVVLGPNSWGFVNTVGGVSPGIFEDVPRTTGSVAVMAHSGGIARTVMPRLVEAGAGVTYVVTLGNEAMIDAAAMLEYFVEDEATRAVVAYLEALRAPDRFLRAVQHANAVGKPVIVYQVGSSGPSTRVAVAHTGALVGDERALDAVYRQYGVIRVSSVDDLAPTGAVAAATGPLEHPALAFVTTSGGAMAPVTDRAHMRGLPMANFADATLDRLGPLLPSYVAVQNPVDTTDRPLHEPELLGQIIDAVARDPDVGVLVAGGLGLQDDEIIGRAVAAVALALEDVQLPWGVLLASAYQRRLACEAGAPFALGRVSDLVDSLARVWWWSQRRMRREPPPPARQIASSVPGVQTLSEWASRELVAGAGVPVVPAQLTQSADEAVAAARAFSCPVAIKVVAADLPHKSDAGGVRLDVEGAEAVRDAYAAVRVAANGVPVEGVLVAPMRRGGVELIVGVTRHLEWGQMLAVGSGGVLTEIVDDVTLRRLPVAAADVREMLAELRCASLLSGGRGSEATDVERLVDVVLRFASLAYQLTPQLETIELNPLWVRGGEVEGLDVLVEWAEADLGQRPARAPDRTTQAETSSGSEAGT
jgi:acetate---CoA ligase (ADP-forming)